MWYMIGLAVGIVALTMALVIRDQKRQAHEAARAATGAEMEEPTPGLWQNYPVKTTLAVLVLLVTGVVLVRAVFTEVPGTVILFAGLANLGAWLALAAMRTYPPEEVQRWEAVDEEWGSYNGDNQGFYYSVADRFEFTFHNRHFNVLSPWYDD